MSDLFNKVDKLLNKAISRDWFPSAVYLLGVQGQVIITKAFGDAVVVPIRIRATTETIYDVASLAKVLVTTLLAVRAAERGLLGLDDGVARFLPEFDHAQKRPMTLRHLLTHTSGFPSWRPLYAEASDRRQLVECLARLPLEHPPGMKVVYSDLGFITLGAVLERVYQTDFGTLARREIFGPLGLKRTFFNPPIGWRAEIAGSELDMSSEKDEARQLGFDVDAMALWDRGPIWGEVNDGNAYFMGGAASHGGLFTTAAETFRMAQQFLPGSRLLNPESLGLFSRSHTAGLNRERSLGWMLARTDGCAAGSALPRDAFGHTGFTGTSLWIDPHRQRVYILLTNRTHPRRRTVDMNKLRQQFHEYAAGALDKRC